jgi:alanyl-tRNA synthetase
MITQNIRRQFLNYFKNHHHSIIPSSAVVPHDDPTLLFNNAGMNQFKDVFLGKSKRDYTRAATSQKCIRVGGKHNDLENVGHTSRHLTFFEMLGNFSFGDYFKKDAIQFAWEVSTTIFGFDPSRIWPTVFLEDDEAFELWTRYVPAERITRLGEKDNFWAMGDTGPCGPCSELLYDRGDRYGKGSSPLEDPSGERFLEFWNLVFMQYNRLPSGDKEPLPKPSIDTGAGLERVMSLIMNVDTVFETDILRSLISQIEDVTSVRYNLDNHQQAPAFRVIADHLRCLSFAIADGVQPSNVDRGYVLRKVLRRAVRYGRLLGMDELFLGQLVPRLVDLMGSDYPELATNRSRIIEILSVEEEAFIRTLRRGGTILNQIIDKSQDANKKISGDDAFKLKDTYGLPIEEILLIAKDNSLTVDTDRYQLLEEEAKKRSRSVHKTMRQVASENLFADYAAQHGECRFLGYSNESAKGKVCAIVVNGAMVNEIAAGDDAMVVLDATSFYPEMGGQIGDMGDLWSDDHTTRFKVIDCQAPYKGIIAHKGRLQKGAIRVGEILNTEVDRVCRQKIANNHTATHLLHWALHRVLGEHVKQAGSVVDPNHLRFDFSHHKALTPVEIQQIEDLVNAKIRENLPVKSYEISYEEAQKQQEIKQFFGEKYGSRVRVVDIDYSKELCGGTHTSAVGNIGLFRIEKEGSIAAGIRRIEAVTGKEAEGLFRRSEESLQQIASLVKAQPQQLKERIEKLIEENRALSQELKGLKESQLKDLVATLLNRVEMINGIPFLSSSLKVTTEELRICADEAIELLKTGVVILATVQGDKCHLIARVSDDLILKGLNAQDLIKAIAPIIEGSGGGKKQMAQAGGKAPDKVPEALAKVRELMANHQT